MLVDVVELVAEVVVLGTDAEELEEGPREIFEALTLVIEELEGKKVTMRSGLPGWDKEGWIEGSTEEVTEDKGCSVGVKVPEHP